MNVSVFVLIFYVVEKRALIRFIELANLAIAVILATSAMRQSVYADLGNDMPKVASKKPLFVFEALGSLACGFHGNYIFFRLRDIYGFRDVAEKAGFEHAEYLSRLSKKKLGITPGEFRKQAVPTGK